VSATSTSIESSANTYRTPTFWGGLWRMSGVHFVVMFVVAYAIYGYQPAVGAAPDALVAFYAGSRIRILVAAVIAGVAILNLMWFAAAIRTTLAERAQDGWGAAATAASAAVGALFLLDVTVGAALACSIAAAGNQGLASALNDLSWACVVVSSFPRAMLVMAGTFGLWRAGLVSNTWFSGGVAAVVLVLLGGTTWLGDGFWSPAGAYSRFVSPIIVLAWIVLATRVLVTRAPAPRTGW